MMEALASSDWWRIVSVFGLGGFFSLITIINPPATLPFFSSLCTDLDDRQAARLARKASLYALGIMLVSLFAGGLIMKMFGISYGALRIAGGLVVSLLGHGMLYGPIKPPPGTTPTYANPAFFPLALPGITGPGTIAVVIGLSTEIRELDRAALEALAYAAIIFAMVVACFIEYLTLRSARRLLSRMGPAGIEAMTRLMGFLLICVGVQFIASGVKSLMAGG
jgi:multiple antibiotic resistance protein